MKGMVSKMLRLPPLLLVVFSTLASFLHVPAGALAREWTDSTGLYTIEATLFGMSAHSVILKADRKKKPTGAELLIIPIDKLSKQDQEYLQSKEALAVHESSSEKQTWRMRDGTVIIGRVVDYGQKDVTLQRRRGKIYVNDRLISNLPEIYQKMIPKIVENFESIQLPDDKAFHAWMERQKANPRTFHCEGVLMEFENGDEYAIPFFFFSSDDLKVLEPGWERWLAHATDTKQREEERFYLESQARAYQQDRENQQRMSMIQLELLAVGAGVVDLWEVGLEPGPRVRGYPFSVIVPARNSDQASALALQKNPGYVLGAVARVSRR